MDWIFWSLVAGGILLTFVVWVWCMVGFYTAAAAGAVQAIRDAAKEPE